jgi:hypothetical protein
MATLQEQLGHQMMLKVEAILETERLRARVAELEAWQKEVASGLGYLNQPEGQSGYEVAAPSVIIQDWHEAQDFTDRYREALENLVSPLLRIYPLEMSGIQAPPSVKPHLEHAIAILNQQ